MSKQSEAAIVAYAVGTIKRKYPSAYVVKINDRMTRGIPDILAVLVNSHGDLVLVAIEAKTPTGRLSGIQQYTQQTLLSLAAKCCQGRIIYRVVRSKQGMEEVIESIESLHYDARRTDCGSHQIRPRSSPSD